MKKRLYTVAAVLLILGISACGRPAEEPQAVITDGPQVYGVIQDVSSDGTSVLVDSKTDVVNGLIWVMTDDQTVFDDGVSRTFEIGSTAAFIVTGGIMESYPMQAYADVAVKNEIPEE